MSNKDMIGKIMVLASSLDKPENEFNFKNLSQKTDKELALIHSQLENAYGEVLSFNMHKYNLKVRTDINPLRDAALEAYKSFKDKDEVPIDVEIITETRIGDLYNGIWFDIINGIAHFTRASIIYADDVPGHFFVQIANNYDLSSMKEEEIHPFLTKLFYDFLELIETFKTMTISEVINAMKEKLACLNKRNSLGLQKNNQPTFSITVLPKKEITEIYLDYEFKNKHIRDKFTLNNSNQKLMLENVSVNKKIMQRYSSCKPI